MGNLDDFGAALFNESELKRNRSARKEIHEQPCNPVKSFSFNSIQWSVLKDNKYLTCGVTEEKLPAGLYDFLQTDIGIVFNKMEVNVDEILEFPDDISHRIMTETEAFWNAKEKFEEYKFLHRRGYLLYGPAGNGKSMAVQLIIKKVIERNGVAFLCGNCPPELADQALRTFRTVEPHRHIVCIFEDIEAYIDSYRESQILSLLDGENQMDDVLNIATTNYPEKLDKRIVGRPRRFDRLLKITTPEIQIRELYLERKLHLKNGEAKKWAEKTKGFSFAALADLVISVKCLNKDLDETIKLLEELLNNKASSSEFDNNKMGFGSN